MPALKMVKCLIIGVVFRRPTNYLLRDLFLKSPIIVLVLVIEIIGRMLVCRLLS